MGSGGEYARKGGGKEEEGIHTVGEKRKEVAKARVGEWVNSSVGVWMRTMTLPDHRKPFGESHAAVCWHNIHTTRSAARSPDETRPCGRRQTLCFYCLPQSTTANPVLLLSSPKRNLANVGVRMIVPAVDTFPVFGTHIMT